MVPLTEASLEDAGGWWLVPQVDLVHNTSWVPAVSKNSLEEKC